MVGADRLGDGGEAVGFELAGEVALDAVGQAGTVVDQRRVELHQGRAGTNFGIGVEAAFHPADGGVLRLSELSIGYENLAIIGGTTLLCTGLALFFRFTRLGVAMQAASQNQLAAYYVGIPVKRIYSIVWAMSAGIAAFAGVLVAPVSLIDPMMGFIGIKAFAAAIVGGFGNLVGVFDARRDRGAGRG